MNEYTIFYKKYKYGFLPLLLISFAAVAFDGAVAFFMYRTGIDIYYLIIPLVSLGFSILFLLYVLASNLRMRYTTFIKWLYFLGNFLIPLGFLGYELFYNRHLFITIPALGFYVGTKFVISLLLIIFTRNYFLNNSKFHNAKKPVWIIIYIFTFAVIIGALYSGNQIRLNGIYGQKESKTVIYRMETDNTLTAVGAIADNNSTVIINDTFDGLKVKKIDTSLLNQADIKEVVLNSPDIQFVGVENLDSEKDLQVKVDKAAMDAIKDEFYNLNDKTSIALANALVPANLDLDEVYINFVYDETSINIVKEKRIKTWFGKKGDTFDLLAYANLDYVRYSDKSSQEHLRWNYDNNNKLILTAESKPFVVTESIDSYDIKFEQIYKLDIKESNDQKYEGLHPNSGIRLTTITNADETLAAYPTRAGFSLEWLDNGQAIESSISDYLKNNNLIEVNLSPSWSIITPEVKANLKDNYNLTYGDTFSDDVDVTPAAEDILLKYYIYKKFGNRETIVQTFTDNNIDITGLKPQDSGTYYIRIESYALDSSLNNLVEKSFNIDIDKKEINFVWKTPTSDIYSAEEKIVGVNYKPSDVVYNDAIIFDLYQDDNLLLYNEAKIMNAGTYNFRITLGSETANLYVIKANNDSLTYKINKKDVTINYNQESLSHVYNKQAYLPTVDGLDGICEGEKGNTAYVISSNVLAIAKGNYVATVSLDNDNYNLTNPKTNFEITAKLLEVNWNNLAFTYDGEEHNPDFVITSGLCGDDEAEYSLTSPKVEAGDYNVKVTIGNQNYYVDSNDATANFKINKRDITITANAVNVIYGDEYNLTYTQSEDLILGNSFSGSLSVDDGKNVGVKEIKVGSLSAGANYNIVYVPANLVIAKKTINVKASAKEVTYGSSKELTYVADNLVYDDTFSGELTREEGTDVGQYQITQGTLALSDNYDLVYTGNVYIISPKEIVISWKDDVTYNGQNQVNNFIPTYLDIEGNEIELKLSTDEMINAASYTITASFKNGETNYKLPANTSHTYNINKKEIEIIWNTDELIYDGTNKVDNLIPAYYDVNEALVKLKIDKDTFINAGSYTVNASFNNSETNYQLPANKSNTYVIKPLDVTVVWPDVELTYDGQNHKNELIPTYKDINNNDIKLDFEETIITNAGTYNLTAIFKNVDNNYNLANNTKKTYIVSPKEITINWKDVNLTYNGKNQIASLYPTYKDVNNNDIKLGLDVSEVINAGKYDLTAVLTDSPNYVLPNNKTHEYTVSAKEITIIWNTNKVYYTGSNQLETFEPSYKDINYNVIKLALEDVIEMVNVGTYEVNASFATTDSNYKLPNDVSHTYEILIADNEFTTEFSAAGQTYGNALEITTPVAKFGTPVIKYYTDNLCENEINITDHTDVGTYYAKTTVDATTNYKGLSKIYNFEIGKREITITWNELELYYNGTNQASSVKASYQNIDGKIVALSVSADANIPSDLYMVDAGTYTAYALFKDATANYKLPTSTSHQYTINKRSVSANWPSVSLVYNDTNQISAVTPTYKDVNNNDVKLSISNYSTIRYVGKYELTAEFNNGETNYILTSNTHNYEMVAKEVEVVWGDVDLVYDGTDQSSKIKPYYLDVYDSKVYLKTDASNIINAWTYHVIASFATTDNNYKLTNSDKYIEVAKREIDIDWHETSLEYTGENQISNVAPTYKDVNNQDVQLSINRTNITEVGSYEVEVTFKNNESNYKLPAETTNTYYITKATNTFTTSFDVPDYEYGQTPNITLPVAKFGTPVIKYYSDSEYENEINVTFNTLTPATYYYKVTVTETDNYTGLADSGSFIVSKRNVKILTNKEEVTYGTNIVYGENQNIKIYYKDALNQDVDFEIDLEKTELKGIQDVGVYKVYVKPFSSILYQLEGLNYIDIKVVPKEIDIIWENTEFTYDGTDHFYEVKVYYVNINGEKVYFDLEETPLIVPNQISFTVDTSSVSTNYKISSKSKTTNVVTVNKKEIVIDWGTNVFTYGDYINTDQIGKKWVCSFTGTNFNAINITFEDVNGIKKSLDYTNETGATALALGWSDMVEPGEYTLFAIFKAGNDSLYYKLPEVTSHTFTVVKKPVDVVWSNEYDDEAYFLDAVGTQRALHVDDSNETYYVAEFEEKDQKSPTLYILNPETTKKDK